MHQLTHQTSDMGDCNYYNDYAYVSLKRLCLCLHNVTMKNLLKFERANVRLSTVTKIKNIL